MKASHGEKQSCTLLVAAAFLAVLVAVVSDLAAGEAALHVASLGLVTGAMAMLRVRLAGRDRGLLQFLSGCVVAQPAVHAAVKLVPHAPLDHGVGTEIGRADLAVAATQLVIALLIVATVSFAEQVLTLVSGVIRVWALRLQLTVPSAGPDARTCRRIPERAQLSRRYRPVAVRKRGPPHAPRRPEQLLVPRIRRNPSSLRLTSRSTARTPDASAVASVSTLLAPTSLGDPCANPD